MNRIAQLLREMLSRRPSREDLLRRGIYKGRHTTVVQVTLVLRCWNETCYSS